MRQLFNTKEFTVATALTGSLLLAGSGFAQERRADMTPRTGSSPARARIAPPSDATMRVAAPLIELAAVSKEEIARRKHQGRAPVGQNRAVDTEKFHGSWMRRADGKWVWAAAIRSVSAAGLRLHFTNFDAGQGSVWVHDGSPDAGQVLGPYSGSGPMKDGDFWTELIDQDRVWIEYAPGDGRTSGDPPFAVPELFHLWEALTSPRDVNLSCLLDEVCYDGNTIVGTFSKAVAYLVFSDHTCTGTLLNDRNSTNTPYLLTAGHCILDDSDARSMLAVFNFKSLSCNGPVNNYGSFPQVSGSTLLARNLHSPDGGMTLIADQPDFAFVKLNGFPPGVPYILMGWAFNPSASDRMTSVSHPRNLSQRLASGGIIASSDPNFFTVNMGQGAVDHGSSGSGLINDSDQVVASDSYGANDESVSVCDSTDHTAGYSKFSATYPFIQQWLEAAAPATPIASLTPVALNFGTQQAGTASGSQSATLSNAGKGSMTISGILIQGPNSSEFSKSTSCGGVLAAGASCTITVTFRPASAGSKSASISIADNSSGGVQTIALSGTGSAGAAAPTVLNEVTSSFDPLASGAGCHTPSAVSTFATTASAVWLYFDVTGASTTDVYRLAYYKPDGTLYTVLSAQSSYAGYECFSYYISVAGFPPASLPGVWTIRTYWNSSTTPIFTRTFNLSSQTSLPAITSGRVVNGATFLDGLTSGGFFTISGSNLATSTQTWSVPGVNLPTTTGGSQVFVNGKPAYISYASPTQINALAPVDSFIGPVSVEVVTPAGTSNTASVNKKAVAPGLFMFAQGGQRYAVVTSSDGSYSIPAGLIPGARIRAAKPGDVVTLWTTGLGPTSPPYPDGQIVTKVGVLTMPHSATIGGKPASISFAGIVGPGLYQINLQVPQVPPGDNAVVLTVNGVTSQSGAYIYVGQ